jgi:histidinol-phosphate aminotransferase
MQYIKLNSNETSTPPSPKVLEAVSAPLINSMGLYEDPHCMELRTAIAEVYNISKEQVFVGNGSDEVLGFCFLSFFSHNSRICFPDITYGFYRVYASTFGIDASEIPLMPDFSINVQDYVKTDRHVIIANPNAPTGLCLSIEQIEQIVKANPKRLVVIDEAYVDYGNKSCIPLLKHYSNLIVIQTFSKSRNLAGARIGFAIASKEIIKDHCCQLNTTANT